MLFSIRSLLALPLVGLAFHASLSEAGVVRGHGHMNAHSRLHLRLSDTLKHVQRDASTQQLQSEATAFLSWMDNFFNSTNATNSASSLSQVKTEIQQHQAAVKSFIDDATRSKSVPPSSLSQLQSEADAFKSWSDAWLSSASSTSSASAISQLSTEVQAYKGWLNTWLGNGDSTTIPPPPSAPVASVVPAPTQAPASNPAPPPPAPAPESSSTSTEATTPEQSPVESAPVIPSSPALAQPTAAPRPHAPGPAPSPASAPSGNSGSSNLAVWWGQSGAASTYDLSKMCSDPSIDIVVLAFLNKFFAQGNMPTLNLGPASGAMSQAQSSAGAAGLFDGSSLVPAIQACQKSGKKVMLSLGGAVQYSSSTFTSDAQASQFADTMWNLFLGGQSPLRPFGSTVLDGIDVDNESHNPTGYTAFVSALRSKFSSDSSRKFYLSGAPQCPRPDASIPLAAMKQMDFVWVQFYNNGAANCNHGQQGDGSANNPGFAGSLKAWSQDLAGSDAKLYVAAVADSSQGSGYIPTEQLTQEVASVKKMGLSNFGGYALWDGSLAMGNEDMQTAVKKALTA